MYSHAKKPIHLHAILKHGIVGKMLGNIIYRKHNIHSSQPRTRKHQDIETAWMLINIKTPNNHKKIWNKIFLGEDWVSHLNDKRQLKCHRYFFPASCCLSCTSGAHEGSDNIVDFVSVLVPVHHSRRYTILHTHTTKGRPTRGRIH